MRKLIAPMLPLLALAGCVFPSIAQRQAYLAQFVGASEADLVRTFGVPSRTIDADGHHFLAYVEQHDDVLPGYAYGYNAYGYGYGYGPFFGPPVFGASQVVVRSCETTFELNGGKVTTFTLRGNACG